MSRLPSHRRDSGTLVPRPATARGSSWCRLGVLLVAWLTLLSPAVRALNPAEKPSNYIVATWDTESGLPHNAVKSIYQTADGYLWIGTQQGLARFDGIRFTIYNHHNTPQLLNSQITSFAETHDGSLWVGTSFGLVRYYHQQFQTYTQADGVRSASGTINALCVAPDGSLWIGSQDGITRWSDGHFRYDVNLSAYDTLGLRALLVDHSNVIWIGFGSFVLRYQNGTFTRFGTAEGLPTAQLQQLTLDANGNVLAVTQDGLYRFEYDRFAPFEQNARLSSVRAIDAHTDRAGNLWVGSAAGLDRYVNGRVVPFLDPFGKSPGVANVIYEDREECLWVGMSTGLYRLTNRRGYSLDRADQLGGTQIVAVNQTRDGAMWIASWAGGLDRLLNGEATHFAPGAPLSHETVTCIYETANGGMWLGTRGSSLDWLEGKNVKTYVYEPGVATSRPVTAIYDQPGDGVLLGINRRGLLTLRNGSITPVPEAAELSSQTVWTINRLRNGRLLIGTSNGIYERQRDGRWLPVQIDGLQPPVVVRALLERPDGTVWLATDGHGLVRWRGNVGTAYGSVRGMVDDTLFSVCEDGLGSLWVSSARSIARIRETEFAEVDAGALPSLNCMTFGRDDGLLNGSTAGNGAPSAVRLADGRIMTATDNGVALIDPRHLEANSRPPNVVIESLVADDHNLPLDTRVVVPPGANRLEIKYTALSFISPLRLRFRYQLVGSDPTWVEAVHARTATYTHLAPGQYAFRVRACNNDGIWNDVGATVAIDVRPQFHQTPLFRFLVVAGALGVIGVVVGWRVRQLKRKQVALARANAELDKRVQERTAALSRSNEELEQRESLFRLIFEHAPVGISWHRTDLGAEHHFNSAFQQILGLSASSSDATLITRLVHPDDADRLTKLDAAVTAGTSDSFAVELRFLRPGGTQVQGLFATAVVRDDQGRVIQVIGILEDITARKNAEQELARTFKRLMEVSRASGMAEVATGVLHNVGNVLNSVNVSVSVVADGLRQSRIGGLAKLTGLLQEHAQNLGAFLAEDPRGQRVVPYLASLSEHLEADHERLLGEIESLRANLEHIKEIVARQQNLARQGGLLERVAPAELFDDALEMNAMTLSRHAVQVTREFETTPLIVTERHKVLQILINLIQNAKEALKVGRVGQRQLTLRIFTRDQRVVFEVSDNGIGIEPEYLTRIFEHGFTTRSNGHGFGLHSSAIAAKQMNGLLTAHSDGIGTGARFVLELPLSQGASVVVNVPSP